MSLDITQPFTLVINGVSLPMRPTLAKETGNTYWAVLKPLKNGTRKFLRGGVPLAIAGALPKHVELVDQEGNKHRLATEPAPAEYKNRDTGKMEKRAHPAVVHHSTLEFGEVKKQVKVYVSDLGDGRKNVIATINGVGGGTGASVTFSPSDL